MNGMVVNSWPYVVAAYVITWVVVIGYSTYLYRESRRIRDAHTEMSTNR